MDDMIVLRERNPATAEFVEVWRAKYGRSFDLTDEAEKATFYEGMVEMARHIATSSELAGLVVVPSSNGVMQIVANAMPSSDELNKFVKDKRAETRLPEPPG